MSSPEQVSCSPLRSWAHIISSLILLPHSQGALQNLLSKYLRSGACCRCTERFPFLDVPKPRATNIWPSSNVKFLGGRGIGSIFEAFLNISNAMSFPSATSPVQFSWMNLALGITICMEKRRVWGYLSDSLHLQWCTFHQKCRAKQP